MWTGFKNLSLRRVVGSLAISLFAVSSTASSAFAGPNGLGPDPAFVQSFEPAGDAVPTNAAIVITFTEPMAPDRVVVSISPSVSGELTWIDDWTVRLQPIGLWHSTTYEVSLRGRTLAGGRLRGQKVFRFSTVGGPPAAIAPGPTAVRVPMLLYHYIRVNPDTRDGMGYKLSVTPANFSAQMDWLALNGFHPVTLQEVVNFLAGRSGLPSKPIVLTFDDGYSDFFTTAVPILRSHDFTAVSFVVTGFVGRQGYMTKFQVIAAHTAGFEIGAHTVDHVSLIKQSDEGVRYQVTASKQTLEEWLGHPVVSFAYPYGAFGQREVAAVGAAGYQDATVTSVSGSYRSLSNRLVWSRIRVLGGENLWQFGYSVNTA